MRPNPAGGNFPGPCHAEPDTLAHSLAQRTGCRCISANRRVPETAMFDLEHFITECRAALAADPSHQLVREVVARAVADPGGVLRGLGEPGRAEIQKLYHAPDLT